MLNNKMSKNWPSIRVLASWHHKGHLAFQGNFQLQIPQIKIKLLSATSFSRTPQVPDKMTHTGTLRFYGLLSNITAIPEIHIICCFKMFNGNVARLFHTITLFRCYINPLHAKCWSKYLLFFPSIYVHSDFQEDF